MAIVHAYDGSDLTAPQTVQLMDERGGFMARATGAQGVSISVIVDDPDATLDFIGYKAWRTRETACPSGNQVIWAGFVGDQTIARGEGVMYPAGAGRRWELELQELNSFIRRRLLISGAKRSEETVAERLTWLFTTNGFTGGLIVDHGLVQASSLTMNEMDYTGSTGDDVLNGAAVRTGYTPYVRYREATDDYEVIFLDFHASGLDTSDLKISNVAADIANPAANPWPPSMNSRLKRSPTRRASGMGMPYPNGFVYRQRAATQAAIGDVDLLAPAGDVKTEATAVETVLRLLDQQAEQEEIVTTTLRLPAANVNDAKHGQLVQAKFSHFLSSVWDWTDYVYCRVLSRNIRRPEHLPQDFYDVDYELMPTTPSFPADSLALLRGPNDNNYVADSSATFRVNFDGDGDTGTPPGGCSLEPLTGNFAYVGSAGERTGIKCLGSGTVRIQCHGTCAGADSGAVVLTAYVLVNGVAVGSDTQSTDGGLRAINWTWDIDVSDVAVVADDVIECHFARTASGNPFVIPAGTGDCSNLLRVTGDLAA